MPEYKWPAMEKRRVIGKRLNRLDGIPKASGKAKYTSDLNPEGQLFGAILTSPHAHAKVKSIDLSAAEKMKGVTSVRVVAPAGTEIQWAGAEIVYVAAEKETIARDAVRAIKIEYELMPHLVNEADLKKAGARAKAAGEQVSGDPDAAFQSAEVTAEGFYGIPVITHCCLEPHGQVVAWKGDAVQYWPSSQNVSGVGGDLARSLGIPVNSVKVEMDYMGGGFGSKFPSDIWGREAAQMSKASGGRPVKLYLDRATELTIAGVRPSAFAKVKVAAKRDGTITAWQSESWATGGVGGGGMAPIPYVFTQIPNKRMNHTAVSTNTGGARAWRAPNHPQASFITCAALEDLAAKLNMDPTELFKKNLGYTPRAAVYEKQIDKAMQMIDWKKRWHPRGDKTPGVIKRGVGMGIATWGGAGHASDCRVNIHPDGMVDIELGSQDIGTATRTCIAMVVAEVLGLNYTQVNVKLGNNAYPPSGASGGSTTIGGVSSSSLKAATNALEKLFENIAASLGTTPDNLEAVDSTVRVKGNPQKSIPWKQACQKLGSKTISELGRNDPKNPGGLNTQGVGGIQMAAVSVDIETGVVKMDKFIAVQDCGLVVNPKTAESQVFGAMIMSVCSALSEERIMDDTTGRVLNADMEFYKLSGISDIGEMEVHMDISPEHDKRGVIGLGEPCAIGGVAAIANAVANAIGVRVPEVPLTPDRVLQALYGSKLGRVTA